MGCLLMVKTFRGRLGFGGVAGKKIDGRKMEQP
jgi:hypothetical protein